MPIKTFFPDGYTTMFDSDAAINGVCLGIYTIPAGTSWSKSWSYLAGCTLRVSTLWGSNPAMASGDPSWPITVSNSPIPTVTANAFAYQRRIIVWATGIPSIMSVPGIQAVGANSTIALSPQARGLNYIGQASYYAKVDSFYNAESSAELGYWRIRISAPSNAQVVGIPRLDDGTWIIGGAPYFTYIGSNTWEATIQATDAKPTIAVGWPNLRTPPVYCFTKPATPVTSPVCAIYDDDGTLAFDLLAGKLLQSAGRITIPSANTGAYLSPVSGNFGIYGDPNLWQWRSVKTGTVFEYRGGVYRGGNYITIASCLYRQSSEPNTSNYDNVQWGQSDFEIIDLSGY